MRNAKLVLIGLLCSFHLLVYSQTTQIKGVVIAASDGEPVIGASVFVKGTSIGVVTDLDGKFTLDVPVNTAKISFSYVGMRTVELAVTPNMRVMMEPATEELQDVVVQAGIIQRDRVSFTGSYTMVTGDELKLVGNQNLLQSLKSLDPAFVILDNNIFGADPNSMPVIELRGESAGIITEIKGEHNDRNATQSSLPLFILNGFETTLQRVNDLDMNRIESITILKDAGSTAIYGAKAANGVIIIETIKPKPGQVRVEYKNDSNISWADLGSYNMMNAAEKLEFERLAGKYSVRNISTENMQLDLAYKEIYNEYLKRVREGVDTYWLKEPIRTAFTTRNSVSFSGGSNDLMFTAGASYKSQQGVMKGSDRNTWEGYLDLTYRNRNVDVINELSITGTDIKNSPYEPFSDWVRANPYFTMRNKDGEVEKYLERPSDTQADSRSVIVGDTYNPLYNALLESFDKGSHFSVTNNLQLVWRIRPDLNFRGSVSLSKEVKDNSAFIDPRNTAFENKIYTEKGSYTKSNYSGWNYELNALLVYSKKFLDAHNLSVTGRAEMGEQNYSQTRFTAIGFPVGTSGVPSYANSYEKDSRPVYNSDTWRKVNLLGVVNYSYKYRYLFDFTYRLDGTTTFGSNKKFKTFWSTGVGWNIHAEGFAENWDWLHFFKIRATYGVTGNQDIGTMYSSSVYSYYNGNTLFGQGAYLSMYGNPNLEWSLSKKTSVGMDLELLEKRFTLRADVFYDKTDPMAIAIPQPPSIGISSLPTNLGHFKNKGIEFNVAFSPIYKKKEGIVWTIRAMGLSTKGKYGGMNDALEALNIVEDYKSSASLKKYQDGYGKKDIFTVRSLGIDPATGNEVFLTKDGKKTVTYNFDDRVHVGSTNPAILGSFSTFFMYKKLEVNFMVRYSIGGKAENRALLEKVENISSSNISYNQDKRALYDRWQKPGDIAQFKRIDDTSTTNMSSRFIQKNNYLTGESISLSWDFSSYNWVKDLGVNRLRFNAYFNDIFRLSTIKAERTTAYPHQKTISFGISASI